MRIDIRKILRERNMKEPEIRYLTDELKWENLEYTVPYMESLDHRERLIAEYMQTSIRFNHLSSLLGKIRDGKIDFKPNCPVSLLERQCLLMNEYLLLLEERFQYEGIEIREEY